MNAVAGFEGFGGDAFTVDECSVCGVQVSEGVGPSDVGELAVS